MSGRWKNVLYAPAPWVKINITTGIGGLGVMGGYLWRVLTQSSGDTTVARKRYS